MRGFTCHDRASYCKQSRSDQPTSCQGSERAHCFVISIPYSIAHSGRFVAADRSRFPKVTQRGPERCHLDALRTPLCDGGLKRRRGVSHSLEFRAGAPGPGREHHGRLHGVGCAGREGRDRDGPAGDGLDPGVCVDCRGGDDEKVSTSVSPESKRAAHTRSCQGGRVFSTTAFEPLRLPYWHIVQAAVCRDIGDRVERGVRLTQLVSARARLA